MYERTYSNRVLKTEEKPLKKKGGHRRLWKRIAIVIVCVAVCGGLVALLRAERFQVRAVTVEGAVVADPVEIADYTQALLEGRHAWILPKTSIFLVSTETLAQRVQGAFPRLKTVEVDRASMRSLKVQVVEYPGTYLWCDEACSFMDEKGTVFADAPYFSGSAYLKIAIGTREQYPFTPITSEQLALVQMLQEKLEAIDIVPLMMRFESDRKLVISFNHHTHEALLYIDPKEPIDEALMTLYGGLRTEAVARQYHDTSKVLQYLDLRFANKLIYKFQ